MMLNSDWSNPSRPLDVNNDLLITPMDALLIINRLNSRSSGVLPTRTNCLDYYYDVNGDQLSTPMDVLQVVNELNLRSRANGSVNARVEGEAEVGPAGFISVPFTTLPGSSGQIVTVDTKLNIGREEFNEMGLFVVDGPNGAVNGVLPTSPDYAAAVFQSSQRQVLYSKVSNFRIASSAVLPAGKQVSVNVLQPASANGDAAAHLRAREISTGIMRIGWEEQPSVVPGWPTVGDRGYDDAIVDVHIGQPVNSHALPVIAAIPNQTINEQTLLSIQAITMDADLPNDSLFYSLYVAPAGATIDPNTGLIRWTPTEAQGPGNFEVVVRATDSFGAFDTESFFVAVLEVNSPPALAPIPNQQTQPGSTVSFLATAADADLPANRLTFSLGAGAPAGATIDAATGRFSWTVPAGTVASSFPITIRVTDDGKPVLSDSKPFSVNVIHVNTAPVMNTIADQTVNEEILLSVQLVATDTDLPNDLLTYSLVNGPQGATLDPQTGLFRWTPNEAQGPGRFEVVTRVTDRGGLNATKSFFVNVLEVNRAPTLAALVNANAKPGDMVTLTASATDPDLPANTMRFSLGSSAPAGSSIDPVTGAFIWNIPQTISSGNYSIPITVTDNGVPALFDTKSVVINVSSACAFDANLSGWTVFESGGTSTGRGTVIVQDCTAVIREGDSFIVGMERTITIPIEPSAITLAIKNLTFDESSQGFIRDAFEVALVDESGNTLVRSHSTGRDALFNATEGLSTSVAQGIQFSNDTITVGLGGIPAGTTGKLILRLMNDDDDKNSQVAISSVQIIPSTLVATLPGGASSKAFENSNHSATPQNSTFTGIGKLGENLFSNTSTSQVTSTTEGTGNSGKQNSTPSAIKFLTISTPFNSPIGIDHHASTDSVVVSVNYSSGTPVTFERIDSQGNHTPFSDVSGVGDEVKIATVRLGNVGGFTAGDLFSGNGVDGEILRISADGSQVDNPWISLPGSGNGLMRGSLYIDRTGVWGGDLIAVTTAGEVWRIRSDAEPTKIASVGTHLEGLVTVPDDPQRYGPLAGKIIAGAENQGLLYVIDQAGNVSTFSPGVNIEDIDIVPAGENFFGVNFGTGRVLGAPASAFREMVGDILLTQENVAGSGLYRLFWDGTALRTEQLGLASDSAPVGQWEHVTFSPAGIAELPAVPQPPLLVASAPPHSATIGKQVVLSGMAEAFGEASLGRPNFITEISVNGQNAEVIDVGGNFFHSETIQAGRNVFRVQANDAIGQQVFTELTIVGVSSTLGPIDFGSFVDNTADFSSVYSRTSFNEEPKLLYVELATRNDGTFDSDVPLLIGVKNISDPSVSVIGFDGYMPDGVPYFDYSLQVEDGTLSPGEQSLSPSIVFHNPNRGQFDYELVFYGKQNSAPGITSIPDIEALAGKDYRYDVDAIDEDGDALTYSLTQAPTGMSIVPSSGVITWATSTSSIGNVPITVEVSDGRGGVARQDYTLSVIAAPPNRPPVITSAPVTQSVVLAE
ncbi:MAG: putative Ig domain-containing protein [Pirellulaceae bacterium]|nr:putative Ig domain-containing protein [Pirellulaceae bacterium]